MSQRYSLHDEATLVDQLNRLLHSLALPISLISPTDLTPRLLIAILESLLGARLPLFARQGPEGDGGPDDARTTRVQNMKIFLGVLETDILQRDVGLSNIDPRRLADGEDEEVFYVAEVLGAISRDRDRDSELARARSIPLPRTPSPPSSPSPSQITVTVARARPILSPKSQLDLDAATLFQTSTTRHQSHPSLFSALFLADNNNNSTTTSLFSDHHENEYGRASDDGRFSDDSDTGVSDILSGLPPLPSTPPPHQHPSRRYNHDDKDDDNSLLLSVNNPPIPRERAFSAYHHRDDTEGDVTPRSAVRYSGYIAPVDEEQELASFELSRSLTLSSRDVPSRKPRGESVKAQYTRTLELLTERARLLTQLSELKKTTHGHGHG